MMQLWLIVDSFRLPRFDLGLETRRAKRITLNNYFYRSGRSERARFCSLVIESTVLQSGPSGKRGRPRQNAGIRVEEVLAYRPLGIAETFLGHQVDVAAATCRIHRLKILASPPWSNWNRYRDRLDEHFGTVIRSNPRRSHSARIVVRSFYGTICHRVAKATRPDISKCDLICINKNGASNKIDRLFSFEITRMRSTALAREKVMSNRCYAACACPTSAKLFFFFFFLFKKSIHLEIMR